MMMYTVTWKADPVLCKGKGRLKFEEVNINFAVLCDSMLAAQRCFHYHFMYVFKTTHSLSPSDGELLLKRSVVDSRSFHPHYLLLDKMDVPINLHDPVSSLLQYSKKYSSLRL